ncbi:MAG TPA: DUF4173 domain-containing protein [Acidimicrobiales bacterium]|nr:DUF4173 domain-containing protein [Acidimicrobiales bacterium]
MSDLLDVTAWQEGLSVRRPADKGVLAAVAVAAVMTDVALRSGPDGLAGALLVGLVGAGLLLSGRVANPQARAVAATAVVFGLFLALRTSPWLIPFDILAIGGLLVLAASLASGGSLLDLTVPAAVARAVHATLHGLAAPAFLAAAHGGRITSRRTLATMRGLALAVPLLVVLGVLLASADAVFAGFFTGWDVMSPIEHAILLVIGAWGMAGLLRLASAGPPPGPGRLAYRLGRTEATIVLGSLVALFAAFAVAQVVAASEGGRHVIETAGLTYAEYARTGFFQLLAVAAITLGALLGLRAATDLSDPRDRRRFTVLAEVAVALTLVIVVVALVRLNLYEDAFGLTMLRLYATVLAVWIGVVFVLLAVDVGVGRGRGRQWLPSAAVAVGLLALLALNVANPEAMVVRHNVAFAERDGRFDPVYLTDLSDDAVPALVDALPRLGPDARRLVLERVCEMGSAGVSERRWWGSNASRRAAADARREVCVPGRVPAD